MEIRLISGSDSIKELTELVHVAYKELADLGFKYWGVYQSEEDTLERISYGECYVAIENGQIIGTVTLNYPETCEGCLWYDRPEVTAFHQFAVHPDFRKMGIGSKLMDLIEQRAFNLGADELALDIAIGATYLIEMYKKRNYREVGEANWKGTNYKSIIMSKNLIDEKTVI